MWTHLARLAAANAGRESRAMFDRRRPFQLAGKECSKCMIIILLQSPHMETRHAEIVATQASISLATLAVVSVGKSWPSLGKSAYSFTCVCVCVCVCVREPEGPAPSS